MSTVSNTSLLPASRITAVSLMLCFSLVPHLQAADYVVTTKYWQEGADVVKESHLRETFRQMAVLVLRQYGHRPIDESLEGASGDPSLPRIHCLVHKEKADGRFEMSLGLKEDALQRFALPEAKDWSQYTQALTVIQKQLLAIGVPDKNGQGIDAFRAVPEDITRQLDQQGPINSFMAARNVEHLLQHHGKAAPLLECLAEAYANLSRDADLNPDGGRHVYRARAKLAAWELRTLRADSRSMWVHAYVAAMVGDYPTARDILAALPDDGAEAPAWAPLLRAFIAWDWQKMMIIGAQSEALLARSFRWLSYQVEMCTEVGLRQRIIDKAVEVAPHDVRLLAAGSYQVNEAPSQGAHAKACLKQLGKPSLDRLVAAGLCAPSAVSGGLPEVAAHTLNQLKNAKDDGLEPRLPALRALLHGLAFYVSVGQAHVRFVNYRDDTTFPFTISDLQPLWSTHTYAPWVQVYNLSQVKSIGEIQARWDALAKVEAQCANFIYRTAPVGFMFPTIHRIPINPVAAVRTTMVDWDPSATTQLRHSAWLVRKDHLGMDARRASVRRLIDQHRCPVGFLWAAKMYKGMGKEDNQRLMADFKTHPAVSGMIARSLMNNKKTLKDAKPYLDIYAAWSPGTASRRLLRDYHQKTGNEDAYVLALEQNLEAEVGRAKGLAARKLVDHYWKLAAAAKKKKDDVDYRRQLDKVIEYGRLSRGSLVMYDTYRLSMFLLYRGDVVEAESLIRSPFGGEANAYSWYQWCLRNKVGDKEAAYAVGKKMYEDSPQDVWPGWAVMCMLKGDYKEAASVYTTYGSLPNRWRPDVYLLWALACHEAGDSAGRDNALKMSAERAFTRGFQEEKRLKQLAAYFAAHVKEGAPAPSKKAIDKLFGAVPYKYKARMSYFAGHVAQALGLKDAARAYYQSCIKGSPPAKAASDQWPVLSMHFMKALEKP